MILCGRRWVECHYCGKRIAAGGDPDYEPITLDHVVPLSRGGAMGIRNIVPACRRCNTIKGSMLYDWFVNRILRGLYRWSA